MRKIEDTLLRPRLLELGFTHQNGVFIKPINEEFVATISFGVSHFGLTGHSFVIPNIGIGHIETNRLKLQLLAKRRNLKYPTIWTPLWKLDNGRTMWEYISDEVSDNILLDEMLSSIMLHGSDYWTRLSKWNNFLAEGLKENDQALVPVLYYINGEKNKGLDFIEKYIESHSKFRSDEEILKSLGGAKENTIIIRPHNHVHMTTEQIEELVKKLPVGGRIISPELEGMDKWYIEFIDRYKNL